MEDNQWTHGPWFAHDNYVVSNRMTKEWAEIVAYCNSEGTARLVQLAPELFDICQILVSIYEDFSAGETSTNMNDFIKVMADAMTTVERINQRVG